MRSLVELLWLFGPSGVGKTTVGWEIFSGLDRAAFIDADQLGLCYPSAADDPYNHGVKARNLGAVWPAMLAAGVRSVVLAGHVEQAEQIGLYTGHVPDAAVTVCRLRAGHATLRERFLGRGWMPQLVDDAVTAADELDRLDFGDLCVDTDGLGVAEAVRLVRDRAAGLAPSIFWESGPSQRPGAGIFQENAGRSAPGTSAADRKAAGGNAAGGNAAGRNAAGRNAAGRNAAGRNAAGRNAAGGNAADRNAGDPGERVPVLMLCGPTAVGKSTVGYGAFTRVFAETKAAYVDLAQIGFCRPAPPDDPGHHRLKAANLAAMWPAFRDAGARCLIVTGRVNDANALRTYAKAFPEMDLTVCRLDAGAEALTERIVGRGRGAGPAIAGNELKGASEAELRRVAERAAAEAARMRLDGIGDFSVDTDGRPVGELAQVIAAKALGML